MSRAGESAEYRSEFLTHLIAPVVILSVLTYLIEANDLDRRFSDRFYDFASASWPLKDNFWIQTLLHQIAQDYVFAFAIIALALWAGSWFKQSWKVLRRPTSYIVIAIGLCAEIVALAKSYSLRPCPWDTVRYGGALDAVSLFAASSTGTGHGHCFPASHATVGYSLFAGYFLLKDRRPALGRAWFAIAMLVGTAFSLAQVARGAHFLSHGIWSAALCWYVCYGVYVIGFRRRLQPVSLVQPLESDAP